MSERDVRQGTWRDLQAFERQAYRDGLRRNGDYRGFFSIDAYGDSKSAGEYIARSCARCLDIGSGVLPHPVYMRPQTRWWGLDPFFGEERRAFPFVQAVGEGLPFPDEVFPCVTFMSTLDHQIMPQDSLREARRVLIPMGLVFLWTDLRPENDGNYLVWKQAPPGTRFDQHHQHAFVRQDILNLLEGVGFSFAEQVNYPGTHYWPPTHLIIGKKL
jgi:hypothetical protein